MTFVADPGAARRACVQPVRPVHRRRKPRRPRLHRRHAAGIVGTRCCRSAAPSPISGRRYRRWESVWQRSGYRPNDFAGARTGGKLGAIAGGPDGGGALEPHQGSRGLSLLLEYLNQSERQTDHTCGVAIIQAVDWSIDERLIQSTSGTVQDLLYFDVLTGLRMPPPHVAKGCTKSAPIRLAVGCPNVISFTSIYHRLLSHV